MKKAKIIGVIVILCISATFAGVKFLKSPSKTYAYSGGNGSAATPYLISSLKDLQDLRSAVNSGNNYAGIYFKQTAPIPNVGNWTPIGYGRATNTDKYFSGIYDGQLYPITSVVLQLSVTAGYRPTNSGGLFGFVSAGTVKNVDITISPITLYPRGDFAYVGGIAAYADGGAVIANCRVKISAVVYGSDGSGWHSYVYLGGIVGSLGGTIRGCYAEGSLKAVGGVFTASHNAYGYCGRLVGIFNSGAFEVYSNPSSNFGNFTTLVALSDNGGIAGNLGVGGGALNSTYKYAGEVRGSFIITATAVAPTTYSVAAPTNNVTGCTISAASRNFAFPSGEYAFTLTLASDYSNSTPSIVLSGGKGTLSSPTKNGNVYTYTVSNVTGNIIASNFTVSGIKSNSVAVTYDANGGAFSDDSTTKTVDHFPESAYGNFISSPTRKYYLFAGWFNSLANADGTDSIGQVTESSIVPSSAHTLYARWIDSSAVVSFNTNYPTNPSAVTLYPSSKAVVYGKSYGALPKPELDGFKFGGWFTSAAYANAIGNETGRVKNTTNVTTLGAHTLYARWVAV